VIQSDRGCAGGEGAGASTFCSLDLFRFVPSTAHVVTANATIAQMIMTPSHLMTEVSTVIGITDIFDLISVTSVRSRSICASSRMMFASLFIGMLRLLLCFNTHEKTTSGRFDLS
jgi:hypothetical protein